ELDLIQYVPNFGGRKRGMRQKLDKFAESALEVDIVFPERIVRVDDQELGDHDPRRHLVGRGARWNGISKTASTSTALPLRNAGVHSHFASASWAVRSSRSSR